MRFGSFICAATRELVAKRPAKKVVKSLAKLAVRLLSSSLFVKNPAKRRGKADIQYHDIGDYLNRDAKLDIINKAGDITGLDWQIITPNEEGDWLNQRNPHFETFIELGNDEVKRGKSITPQTIFHSFSRGVATSRDAWVYNFGRDEVANNMERMIAHYNDQLAKISALRQDNPKADPETISGV